MRLGRTVVRTGVLVAACGVAIAACGGGDEDTAGPPAELAACVEEEGFETDFDSDAAMEGEDAEVVRFPYTVQVYTSPGVVEVIFYDDPDQAAKAAEQGESRFGGVAELVGDQVVVGYEVKSEFAVEEGEGEALADGADAIRTCLGGDAPGAATTPAALISCLRGEGFEPETTVAYGGGAVVGSGTEMVEVQFYNDSQEAQEVTKEVLTNHELVGDTVSIAADPGTDEAEAAARSCLEGQT